MTVPDHPTYPRILTLTEPEWRDLAAVCQMWLTEHPQGVPLCRRIAQRVADMYAREWGKS